MSAFYGTIQGNRGEATRCGSKNSGMETYCASWSGAVRSFAYVGEDGTDMVRVELTPWRGSGVRHTLYEGPIGEYKPK